MKTPWIKCLQHRHDDDSLGPHGPHEWQVGVEAHLECNTKEAETEGVLGKLAS